MRDGHVGHQVPEELVAQRRRPLADEHVGRTHGLQRLGVHHHRDEVAAALLRSTAPVIQRSHRAHTRHQHCADIVRRVARYTTCSLVSIMAQIKHNDHRFIWWHD